MIINLEIDDITFDYLIARSGIIGRQILRLCRYIKKTADQKSDQPSGLERFWLQRRRLRQLLGISAISKLLVVFYTYYIGGSLTRSDQVTFGRLLGMDGNAYRLTLYNAIFCGIPCALGYFLLGEGFSLLKNIHSYAELPSLLAQHTSLGVGLVSLTVDLFRAGDSFWNRRCWAPFGFLPLVINVPTYFKRLFQPTKSPANSRPETQHSSTSKNDQPAPVSVLEKADHHDESCNIVSKNYSGSSRAFLRSR